jgi:O-antigen ligase
MTIIRRIALIIIGTIPIPFAAVQPWVWSVYSLMMIAVVIIALWTLKDLSLFNAGQLNRPLAVFFVWTLFLCLPLPHVILAALTPVRSTTLIQARELTGSAPAWQTISYSAGNALAWWVFLLSLGLFFLVVRHLCQERKHLKRLVFIMIAIGIVEAIYGLIQALVPSMGVLWVDYVQAYLGTARGSFINRNNFAGFLEMIWPLALGVALAMTGRGHSLKAALGSDHLNRQALMALGIIVLLLALILTRSRAGILSGIVGLLTFSSMARTGMQGVARPTRIVLGGILVLLCIYITSIGVGPIMQRFLALPGDSHSRMEIWRDSLAMIKDHPQGIGLRNYGNVFPVYNRSLASDKTVDHAHNDYLQLLIETGWIGFIAMAGAFLTFLVKSARRIKKLDYNRDPLRFYLAVGAFSGLISMGVHSLVDFNLQIPANCLYFVVLMAVLSASGAQNKPAPEFSSTL